MFVNDVPLDEFFIVNSVGAGTSGCVLAAKLAETGKSKVLLLEAGSSPPWYSWIPLIAPIMQGSKTYDWLLRTVPQKKAGGALRNNVISLFVFLIAFQIKCVSRFLIAIQLAPRKNGISIKNYTINEIIKWRFRLVGAVK